MKIYTRSGDEGNTSLLNGERVKKNDIRIELIGIMDELTSYIGFAKSSIEDDIMSTDLENIQNNLMLIMADIAEGKDKSSRIDDNIVNSLEVLIDKYQNIFPKPHKFIIVGANKASSIIDIARTLARKAERRAVEVDKKYPIDKKEKIYLNRLSDFLYTIARYIDFKEELIKKVKAAVKENIFDDNIKKSISSFGLEKAKKLMNAVEIKALNMGLNIVVAVADAKGNLIAVHFMDGALPASLDIAMKKAYTSAALKMTTEQLSKLSQPGQALYGITNANEKIIVFGGGAPIIEEDKIVGAIGISGGTAEEDTELANFASDIYKDIV